MSTNKMIYVWCIAILLVACKSAETVVEGSGNQNAITSVAEPSNQQTISYVAANDKDPEVRKLAVEKSINQQTISYVAANDKDPDVRKAALQRVK